MSQESGAAALADAPELQRRRLRHMLQHLRETVGSSGLTQAEAADLLSWHPRKVSRIEKGETIPSPTDVRAMLQTYGVTDAARIKQVVDVAVMSKRNTRSIWKPFADVHTTGGLTLFACEPAAATILKHELDVIPGVLQTEQYTRSLLESHRMSRRRIDRRVEVLRMRRRILDQDAGPRLDFVIGEAVVSRLVGDYAGMMDQIEHLKVMSRRPDVTLRLVLLNAGVYPMVGANFTILSFDAHTEVADMVCLENAGRVTTVIEDAETINTYRRGFKALDDRCTPPDEFESALSQIVEERFH